MNYLLSVLCYDNKMLYTYTTEIYIRIDVFIPPFFPQGRCYELA